MRGQSPLYRLTPRTLRLTLMFDIGFTELLVIGVVALLVIGPERMPKVARTAGHLFGRFQRYVSSVKSDINREMDLDELRRAGQDFKQSVEDAAHGVESRAVEAEFTMKDEVLSPTEKVLKSMTDLEKHNPVLTPEVEKLKAEQLASSQDSESREDNLPQEQPGAQTELALEDTQAAPATHPNTEKPA